MFVKSMTKEIPDCNCPPGCNRLGQEGRMPVFKVVSGDTWTVDADICAPDGGPAHPKNSYVEFVVSENQFSPPIWTGVWVNGILPDENRPGLVHVMIPRDVTKALRRGSYMFSLRVSDLMRHDFDTQLFGNLLVEYMPTSDQHSIPYRDGTSEIFDSGSSGSKECLQNGNNIGEGVFIPDPKTGKFHKLIAVTDPETGEVDIGVSKNGVVTARRD